MGSRRAVLAPGRSRIVAAGVLTALATLAFGACGVSPRHNFDPVSAEKDIAGQLARQYGGPTPAVSCPGHVTLRTGTTFECTTRIDGQPLTMQARLTSNDGRFTATPNEAVIPVKQAVDSIEASILQQAKRTAVLDCGSRYVIVLPPGGTFDCTAAIKGSPDGRVVVTVTDLKGHLTYSLERSS